MVINITFKKPEIVLFLVFLYLVNFSQAQSYSGVIQVSDSIIFPYYLKLPSPTSQGYSVSDMHGSTETLSLISLKDSGNGIINVEESFAIYTRTNSEDYDDFCKLFFDLKKKNIGSKSMEFDFVAKFNNNTQCAVGLISLEETTNLKNKLDKVKNKIAKKTSKIYISRSLSTPDFKPEREADFYINTSQISKSEIARAKIFHTTCFALKQKPITICHS